jgi:6-phosphogluconolactonase/glucosamine-6-phosphate isomerase/deaminase
MAQIERIQVQDEKEAARVAGLQVTLRLVAAKSGPVLFLYSGGSAIKVLDHIRTDAFGPHLTVMPLDDRFTAELSRSNCLQFENTHCFSVAKSAGSVFIRSVAESGETRDDVANRLNSQLVKWLETNPAGRIVAIVGMGPDGHTAGIMPYPHEEELFSEIFIQTPRYYIAYDAKHRNPMPERVTATVNLLQRVDDVVFYACGSIKKRALVEALQAGAPLHDLPGAIITRMKKVTLVTDIN